MKKLEKRAIICLTLAAILFIGLCIFIGKFVVDGPKWATFYGNSHIYKDGRLAIGSIYDIDGDLLAENKDGTIIYNENESVRRATLHAVGDMNGNISTSAESAFKSQLVGYSLITGTYNVTGRGNKLTLTIDKDVCEAAYSALKGRTGTVGVYNYKTGEILCMVSSPGFDPQNPPTLAPDDTSGKYINRFLSATITPGSIFKLVTSAAAIENKQDIDSWTYRCSGVNVINGEEIRCPYAHGEVDFQSALAKSCNGGFAELTKDIGPTLMDEYVKKCGLTTSYNIDGIKTAAGTFEFPSDADLNLAWAGIGQYNDQLNPCSMMVYMGAIANGGKAAEPKLIHSALSVTDETGRMIDESTAEKLGAMMKNNVEETYGSKNFPGLDIYAKSGTAEVANKQPNAWFSGFIRNADKPYAFIVCVENAGSGSTIAGSVANKVLQAAIAE